MMKMALSDTIIGTILGGLIAGMIGLFVALYQNASSRRERHLVDHQEHFKILRKALLDARGRAWLLYSSGAEPFWLPRLEQSRSSDLESYSISEFQYVERVDENRLMSYVVDEVLYEDLQNHFPDLWSRLRQVQSLLRTDGKEINQAVFQFSGVIHDRFKREELTVFHFGMDGQECHMYDLNELEATGYAGYIFLLMIGIERKYWPNSFDFLQKRGILGGLMRLAENIGSEFRNEKDAMLARVEKVSSEIDDCITVLDKWSHTKKLAGNCDYV